VFVFRHLVHTLLGDMAASHRFILFSAGVAGLTGVACGAFGAHALRESLQARGSTGAWETAVLYHLIHAAALLALARGREPASLPAGRIALWWVAGLVLFSGSLYGLALGAPRWLGPVTPLGGLALLAGWAELLWGAWRQPRP
jgi:uncharacterized membrane protein YgdD (TMEM256/DUF423 family)